MRRDGLRRLFGLLVVSALLTTFSEGFYWYSGGTDFPSRVAVYLVPTTVLLWALARYPATGWPTIVLAGAAYGFVVEGVITAIAYGGFPFDPFAISYPSLAWHALVAVAFGLVLLRRLLLRQSAWLGITVLTAFGAFWAVWAMTLRLPPDPDTELPALPALTGDVSVGAFALYTVAATSVVGLCHLLLGRAVRPADLVPGRWWLWLTGAVGGLWFAILIVPVAPWAPVELAALLFLCCWGLARLSSGGAESRAGRDAAVVGATWDRIPLARCCLLAAVPISATGVYAALVGIAPSAETVRAFLLETVVWAQMLLGWALFAWALVMAARARSSTRRELAPRG